MANENKTNEQTLNDTDSSRSAGYVEEIILKGKTCDRSVGYVEEIILRPEDAAMANVKYVEKKRRKAEKKGKTYEPPAGIPLLNIDTDSSTTERLEI